MSDFQLAIALVLEREGGFVNQVSDHGGATKYGISLHYLRQKKQDATVDDIKNMTVECAIQFYREDWWERFHYDRIFDQKIANKILDLAVNMGGKQAHICVQRALRSSTGEKLQEDGVLGEETFFAMNNAQPDILLSALKSEAAGFYRSLNQPAFEAGWLNRSYL